MKHTNVLPALLASAALGIAAILPSPAYAQTTPVIPDGPVYSPQLQGFDYPYPLSYYHFQSQQQDLQMAYMDVAADPKTANGKTAVLLHGKNYCAATWGPNIINTALSNWRTTHAICCSHSTSGKLP
jgi:hypothetical protein